MEQSKQALMPVGDFIKQVPLGYPIVPMLGVPMLGSQAKHFWEIQENILNETEAFSKNWFERRHKASRAGLEAANNFRESGATNPGAALRTIADWQTQSMQRLVDDFQDWVGLYSRCTAHLANQETQSLEDVKQKAAEAAASPGKP